MPTLLAILATALVAIVVIGYLLTVINFLERVGSLWRRYILRQPKAEPATKEDVAEVKGAVERLAEFVDGLDATAKETLRPAYAEAGRLQREGYQLQSHSKHEEAIAAFRRALPLADNDPQRCALHILMGNSQLQIAQYLQGERSYRAALDLAHNLSNDDERLEVSAAALGNLGLIYFDRGQLDKAEEHHKKALEIHQQIGNRPGQANQLGNLGNVYLQRGELDKAKEHYRKALEIHQQMGNRPGQAAALGNLGLVYAASGDLNKAEQHHKKALAIEEETGNLRGQAQDLGNLGIVYGSRGHPDKAEEHFQRALAIQEEIGDRVGEAKQLGNLGNVYRRRGDPEKARDLLRRAQELYAAIGAGGQGPEIVAAALERLESASPPKPKPKRARKKPPPKP